ncbi:MAG TPA: hypothetical protein VES19_15655 [Candidatus Limnocylindrales bacterium]|nr:hypothetical protein [Candidatus Limnocylindrales bacterium]
MNRPTLRRVALMSALAAILLVTGACSLIPGPERIGRPEPVPIAVSQEQAAEIARGVVQVRQPAKVSGVERMTWAQAMAAGVSSPQLRGEEPDADRPVWLVTIVTVDDGPASTGGEIDQVVVDAIDGRVIAIAQLFS